jgi:hypothetical protein
MDAGAAVGGRFGCCRCLHRFGGPPCALVRVVDWPGAEASFDGYTDGVVTTQYDRPTVLPGPGGDFGTMTVRRTDRSDRCVVG